MGHSLIGRDKLRPLDIRGADKRRPLGDDDLRL